MAKFVPQAELPVSEQAAIRREKLAALQAEGRDPFLQTKFDFNADLTFDDRKTSFLDYHKGHMEFMSKIKVIKKQGKKPCFYFVI